MKIDAHAIAARIDATASCNDDATSRTQNGLTAIRQGRYSFWEINLPEVPASDDDVRAAVCRFFGSEYVGLQVQGTGCGAVRDGYRVSQRGFIVCYLNLPRLES